VRDTLPLFLAVLPLLGAILALALPRLFPGRGPWPLRVAAGFGYGGGLLVALEVFLRLRPWGILQANLGGWAAPWGVEATAGSLEAAVCAAACLALGSNHFLREPDPLDPKAAPVTAFRLLALTGFAASLTLQDALARFGTFQLTGLALAGLWAQSGGEGRRRGFDLLMRFSAGSTLWMFGAGILFVRTGTFHLAGWEARLSSDGPPILAAGTSLALMALGSWILAGLWPGRGWILEAWGSPGGPPPEQAWHTRLFVWQAGDLAWRVFKLSDAVWDAIQVFALAMFLAATLSAWFSKKRWSLSGLLDLASVAVLVGLSRYGRGPLTLALTAQAWAFGLLLLYGGRTRGRSRWARWATALTLAGFPPAMGFLALHPLLSGWAQYGWATGVFGAGLLGLGWTVWKIWPRLPDGGDSQAVSAPVWDWVLVLGLGLGGLLPLLF